MTGSYDGSTPGGDPATTPALPTTPPGGDPAATPALPTTPAHRLNTWPGIVAVSTLIALIGAVLVLAFGWPISASQPRNLPVVVAPAQAVPAIQANLDAAGRGHFLALTGVADEQSARTALAERTAYGAIVVSPQGPMILKASAASPAAAQAMDQLAAVVSGTAVPAAQETAPLPAGDSRGAAFGAVALPSTLIGLAMGVLFGLMVAGRAKRLVGIALAAVLGGVLFTLVLHSWLGILAGSFLAEAAVMALTLFTVALVVSSVGALLGPPGIGLAIGVFLLLGVPLAGAAAPWQTLPAFWGPLGQWLPAGASAELLRRVAYFPDAAVTAPLLVLLGWLAVGLVLWLLPARRRGVAGLAAA